MSCQSLSEVAFENVFEIIEDKLDIVLHSIQEDSLLMKYQIFDKYCNKNRLLPQPNFLLFPQYFIDFFSRVMLLFFPLYLM